LAGLVDTKRLSNIKKKRVDKIIISPSSGNCNLSNGMIKSGYPDGCAGRCLNDGDTLPALANNIEGSYRAVQRLIYLGHHDIAIITVLPNASSSIEGLEGYRCALQEAGLILNESLIKYGNSQVAGGFRATEELLALPTPPTAIFATNNRMIIGIMKALRAYHIHCPEEIAIIGFDDFEGVICFVAKRFG
jgi:LacI family transcriptional regulator